MRNPFSALWESLNLHAFLTGAVMQMRGYILESAAREEAKTSQRKLRK